jgi:hypothetical protein
MNAAFALIHSPLVGPLSWAPVAAELRRRGVTAVVPALDDDGGGRTPFWQQHAEAASRALRAEPAASPLVLAGHSGAGPLLPAIRERLDRPAAGYLFVDAGIPRDGASRLDLLARELPEAAEPLRAHLAGGGRFPEWTDEDLQEVIPDRALRRGVLAELRPRPLTFWEEPIPAFPGWPDAPCGYLRLSPAYAVPAAEAQERGWACRTLDGGHFHMLVDPVSVAGALLALAAALRPG